MSVTLTDLFCGAGGSSLGATMAGGELRLGLNHSQAAIDTHSHNFPCADHDCEDVASLTTAQIRRYPDSDILLASPECTGHSLAKGARRRKPQAASLFDDGPASSADQDRSRATMWDVPRFAEQKILKGRPYKAIIVENVVDAFAWGENNNGMLFQAWLQALAALGYDHHIVWLNSMLVPPTPQSRDRMYVVLWRKGIRAPDLRIEPECWCESCQKIVAGKQTFKKREGPRWGRYGAQYYFSCPQCYGTVIPGACPASSIIDYSLEAPLIGEREKPLAKNTRERIRRGLQRLQKEPFAIRLTHGVAPKPLTLPLVTATTRHDLSMVMPVSGNTHEATPGNRARDAHLNPLATVHGTLDRALVTRTRRALPGHKSANGALGKDGSAEPTPTLTTQKDLALVMANTENNVPRHAAREAAQTLRTEGGLALVYANRAHGVPKQADLCPTAAACTGGHLGVVVSNYSPGWTRRASEQPIGSVTTQDGHSLVLPYTRSTRTTIADREAVTTLTTRDRLALITPNERCTDDASFRPNSDDYPEHHAPVTENMIDSSRFRMFSLEEIARAMVMDTHVDGNEYVVTGNKKQRMLQLGNAVTPPVMELLVGRVLEALDQHDGS